MSGSAAGSAGRAKSFFIRVETPEGPVDAHVNRRGCTGRWTKKDQEAMEAIVRAARKHFQQSPVGPPETPGHE